jgi:hypothetical protein
MSSMAGEVTTLLELVEVEKIRRVVVASIDLASTRGDGSGLPALRVRALEAGRARLPRGALARQQATIDVEYRTHVDAARELLLDPVRDAIVAELATATTGATDQREGKVSGDPWAILDPAVWRSERSALQREQRRLVVGILNAVRSYESTRRIAYVRDAVVGLEEMAAVERRSVSDLSPTTAEHETIRLYRAVDAVLPPGAFRCYVRAVREMVAQRLMGAELPHGAPSDRDQWLSDESWTERAWNDEPEASPETWFVATLQEAYVAQNERERADAVERDRIKARHSPVESPPLIAETFPDPPPDTSLDTPPDKTLAPAPETTLDPAPETSVDPPDEGTASGTRERVLEPSPAASIPIPPLRPNPVPFVVDRSHHAWICQLPAEQQERAAQEEADFQRAIRMTEEM